MAVVDCETALRSLLDDISSLPIDPPSLYIDLEGIKLGRHGSISIISLFVRPIRKTYLIDIYLLGSAAFATTNANSISLRAILESPKIPKVVFDIRNDSDALFSHYQICVDGIKDLQLMELATRDSSQALVAGLVQCIEKDSSIIYAMQVDWRRVKENVSKLYDSQKGGYYEIFNERPMRPEIQEYCESDVALLLELYDVYNARLYPRDGGGAFWRVQVREETKRRIELSQQPDYDGQARTKICGPWDKWNIEKATEEWNDEVMFNAMTGDMVLDEHDHWVDSSSAA